MRYSRAGIVAVLLAVEVFIGGCVLWALRGGHLGAAAQAESVNRMSEMARVDAGEAPQVLVSDPDSRVVITASTDGKVHVTDHTHLWGWFFGSNSDARLNVERTAGGVSISRAARQHRDEIGFVGIDFQRTEIAVPPNSAIEIAHCGGASIDGIQARDVKIACNDGSLRLTNLQSPSIDAITSDGGIRATGLRIDGGRLQSGDGSIHVALADPNLTVHTQNGDGDTKTYQFGTGGGSLQVATQDGSIHISSNGAL